jgi:hypothetical protein
MLVSLEQGTAEAALPFDVIGTCSATPRLFAVCGTESIVATRFSEELLAAVIALKLLWRVHVVSIPYTHRAMERFASRSLSPFNNRCERSRRIASMPLLVIGQMLSAEFGFEIVRRIVFPVIVHMVDVIALRNRAKIVFIDRAVQELARAPVIPSKTGIPLSAINDLVHAVSPQPDTTL